MNHPGTTSQLVDRLRVRVLRQLRACSKAHDQLCASLIDLMRLDDQVTDDSSLSDEEYIEVQASKVTEAHQSLLYLITGLFGRDTVAEISAQLMAEEKTGDVQPME